MIRIKNSVLLLFTLLLVSAPMTVLASTVPEAGTYQKVMSSETSSLLITTQPNDAIPLNTTTVVDSSMLGTGQSGIYYNLPRLKNAYVYKITQTSAKWKLTDSIYPAIYLPKGVLSPSNYEVIVDIVKISTNSTVASCKVQMLEQLTGDDFIEYKPDVSALSSDTTKIVALNTETKYYNPVLQGNSLVCPNAIYITSNPGDVWLNTTLRYDSTQACKYNTIASGSIDLVQYDKTAGVVTRNYVSTSTVNDITIQVKPYCLSTEGGIVEFQGTDKYSHNTGKLIGGASSDVSYLLADNNNLTLMTKGTTAPTNPTILPAKTNNYYTYNELTQGFLTKLPDTNFRFYEKQSKYYVYSIDNMVNGTYYSPSMNVLDSKIEWNGSGSNVTPVPDPDDKTTYTLRYSETGGLGTPFIDVTPGVEPTLGTPTKEGFKFEGWYVDTALTTKYDWRTFSYVLGASYNIHAKWVPAGKYTVRFYDDKNNTDNSAQFSVDNLPSLPANPKFTGYLFKNWSVVDTVASTSGTPYEAATFTPETNRTYIFKAMWDVQGVILSVTPNKTEYWVGEEVDKSTLVVLVQTDSAGTTKTLSLDEFTVHPDRIEKSGDNSITVTYKATGATETVHLKGKADYITGITASYSGSDLYVGDTVPTGAIKVKLTYKSGKTEETSDLSISPATIKSAGTNTITVTSSGYSTSITINGKRKTSDDINNTERKLTGISATYVGTQLYAGDNISAGDIKVTAKYSDGTTQLLNSGDFNYSPSFVRNSGTNTIDVSYKDKVTKVNISAMEKSSSTITDKDISHRNPNGGSNVNNGSSAGIGNTSAGGTNSGLPNGKDKGTSNGYLSGKNILNGIGSSNTASNIVNEIDILSEVKSAGTKAESVDITLINTAMGNVLTGEIVDLLRSKKITLNITMVSPSDKATRVGFWQFNGKSMESIKEDIDLNITYTRLNRETENIYAIGLCPTPYGIGVSFTATMRDAYVTGSFINLYATNSDASNSRFIRNALWVSESDIELPLTESSYFCVTDAVDVYPEGTDLTKQPVEEEVTEDETEDEEMFEDDDIDSEFSFDEEELVELEKPKKGFNWKLIPIIIIGFVIVAGVIGTTIKIISSRKGNSDEEYDGIVDDIPMDDAFIEDHDEMPTPADALNIPENEEEI